MIIVVVVIISFALAFLQLHHQFRATLSLIGLCPPPFLLSRLSSPFLNFNSSPHSELRQDERARIKFAALTRIEKSKGFGAGACLCVPIQIISLQAG